MAPELWANVGADPGKIPEAFQAGAALEVTPVVEQNESEAVPFGLGVAVHSFNGIQKPDELGQENGRRELFCGNSYCVSYSSLTR
jgi:hypothetical protein